MTTTGFRATTVIRNVRHDAELVARRIPDVANRDDAEYAGKPDMAQAIVAYSPIFSIRQTYILDVDLMLKPVHCCESFTDLGQTPNAPA